MTQQNILKNGFYYHIYKVVLYFYSWFKMSYSYWFPIQKNKAVDAYVWNNNNQIMRRYSAAADVGTGSDEHLLYYVLCDGSILVFKERQRMREVVAMLQQEEGAAALHRGPFRYFMEAEIGTEKTLEEDVLALLTSYDDGHGTFFQDLTHYALTPADLYNFNSGRHVIYDTNDEFLRVTPLATLEPNVILSWQKIAKV